jgi:hypothetical protein
MIVLTGNPGVTRMIMAAPGCRYRWGAPAPEELCRLAGDGRWTWGWTVTVAVALVLLAASLVLAWRRRDRHGSAREWWDSLR